MLQCQAFPLNTRMYNGNAPPQMADNGIVRQWEYFRSPFRIDHSGVDHVAHEYLC